MFLFYFKFSHTSYLCLWLLTFSTLLSTTLHNSVLAFFIVSYENCIIFLKFAKLAFIKLESKPTFHFYALWRLPKTKGLWIVCQGLHLWISKQQLRKRLSNLAKQKRYDVYREKSGSKYVPLFIVNYKKYDLKISRSLLFFGGRISSKLCKNHTMTYDDVFFCRDVLSDFSTVSYLIIWVPVSNFKLMWLFRLKL